MTATMEAKMAAYDAERAAAKHLRMVEEHLRERAPEFTAEQIAECIEDQNREWNGVITTDAERAEMVLIGAWVREQPEWVAARKALADARDVLDSLK